MTDRRILVFGQNGQVGHVLPDALRSLGRVTSLDRAAAEFTNPQHLRELVRSQQPHVVVNAAAYTAVDKAEEDTERDAAHAINAAAPGVIAEEARALGAMILHYSTDYVFDGRKSGSYEEGDPTNPLSEYGRTKLAGENAVRATGARHIILRTSWVFGAHGANFLKTMLRLATEREQLRVAADQSGAPTHAGLIAEVTRTVIEHMMDSPASDSRWGVYHLAPRGETTWFGYARYIIERAAERGARLRLTPDGITPIAAADSPRPASRPANSRLGTGKLVRTFNVVLPTWQEGVDSTLSELIPVSVQ